MKGLNTYDATKFNFIDEGDFIFNYNYVYKKMIYAEFGKDFKTTGLEKYTMKQFLSVFQKYDGTNLSEEAMADVLKELFLRKNGTENDYILGSIDYVTPDLIQTMGMHYSATNANNKTAITINNPISHFKSVFLSNKNFNPGNIGMAVLLTAIHEMQHDKQYQDLNKILKGENLSPEETISSMINLHNITRLVDIEYLNQYLEFDANFEAIKFCQEQFDEGNLKDDFNNKLFLYREIISLLRTTKEEIMRDNFKFYDLANDYLKELNDKDVNNLLKDCTKENIAIFQQKLFDKFDYLHDLRKRLQEELICAMSSEMKNETKHLQKNDKEFSQNPNIIQKVLTADEFNHKDCVDFSKILALANFNVNMLPLINAPQEKI